jgi:hypothetical protein
VSLKRLIPASAVIASFAALAAGSAATPAVAPATPELSTLGARSTKFGITISTNWAGYAITAPPSSSGSSGMSFTDVAATWVQPKATCQVGEASSSAFWVGLGGFDDSSQALEQTGTEADCTAAGKETYSAWYEMVPANPVRVRLKIAPGDKIRAAVLVVGQQVLVSVKNLTRHKKFSKRLPLVQPLDTTSAEWIAEAPSLCPPSGRCSVVPLTNFGSVTFANAAAIGDGHPGTISDPTWVSTQVALAGDPAPSPGRVANTHGALPGTLSPDGRSFSVAWQPSLTPPAGG